MIEKFDTLPRVYVSLYSAFMHNIMILYSFPPIYVPLTQTVLMLLLAGIYDKHLWVLLNPCYLEKDILDSQALKTIWTKTLNV